MSATCTGRRTIKRRGFGPVATLGRFFYLLIGAGNTFLFRTKGWTHLQCFKCLTLIQRFCTICAFSNRQSSSDVVRNETVSFTSFIELIQMIKIKTSDDTFWSMWIHHWHIVHKFLYFLLSVFVQHFVLCIKCVKNYFLFQEEVFEEQLRAPFHSTLPHLQSCIRLLSPCHTSIFGFTGNSVHVCMCVCVYACLCWMRANP